MRVSKERAAENRERIVNAAARLFRERGLSGVGVDALTQAAGLTHGSLYSHFGSKERLACEALSHALSASAERLSGARTLDDYVARYLSQAHRDRPGDGCVMAALAAEIPRQGTAMRHGFTDAVRTAAQRIATLAPETRKPGAPESDSIASDAIASDAIQSDAIETEAIRSDAFGPDDRALAILATMVGALTLARAVDDPALSDRLLAAARARITARER